MIGSGPFQKVELPLYRNGPQSQVAFIFRTFGNSQRDHTTLIKEQTDPPSCHPSVTGPSCRVPNSTDDGPQPRPGQEDQNQDLSSPQGSYVGYVALLISNNTPTGDRAGRNPGAWGDITDTQLAACSVSA